VVGGAVLAALTRTPALILSGALSGVLAFTAVVVLRATLVRDPSGDAESPRLAVALAASAIVVAIAAVGVATSRSWSRRLSVAIGLACVIAGFGGLTYFLVASLIAAGMFPGLLLDRLNLTIALVMGLTALTGIGLLMLPTGPATSVGIGRPWLVSSWHPVAAGFVIGAALAWIWSAFIWPVIPYECCLM
jgi:hypothetical protein